MATFREASATVNAALLPGTGRFDYKAHQALTERRDNRCPAVSGGCEPVRITGSLNVMKRTAPCAAPSRVLDCGSWLAGLLLLSRP